MTARLGQQLGIKSASLRQPVGQLSGGNQQKVVFARCLAGAVQVLLLDEAARAASTWAPGRTSTTSSARSPHRAPA